MEFKSLLSISNLNSTEERFLGYKMAQNLDHPAMNQAPFAFIPALGFDGLEDIELMGIFKYLKFHNRIILPADYLLLFFQFFPAHEMGHYSFYLYQDREKQSLDLKNELADFDNLYNCSSTIRDEIINKDRLS